MIAVTTWVLTPQHPVLLSIIAVSLCAQNAETIIFQKFEKFIQKFNKHYNTIDEFTAKFHVFKANFIRAAQSLNKVSHKVGVTKFFDLTPSEFKKTYRNLRINKGLTGLRVPKIKVDRHVPVPAAWDWRTKGAVGPIKDQGQCGSCWTFSTVGNVEGLDFIHHQTLQNFAEQQIVDCDTTDDGCNGGWMENAMDYITQAGGLMLTVDYPYTATDASDGDSCNFDITKIHVKLNGHQMAGTTDEVKIASMVHQVGPLAIAINADPFQTYSSGIINLDADDCDPTQLDHGVTLVGYGTEDTTDYWIIKNSWGADWGENGYVRVARGTGCCGVNTHVVTAIIV